MSTIPRIAAIIFIFFVMTVSWDVLGGVTTSRTHDQSARLTGNVAGLWGSPQIQRAPHLTFSWKTMKDEVSTETEGGVTKQVRKTVESTQTASESPDSTRVDAKLHLDQRLKGLVWYSLYDVDFNGAWTYTHREQVGGTLTIQLDFPDRDGLYDDFRLFVNGTDRAQDSKPENGVVRVATFVSPGDPVTISVAYKSRGMTSWSYSPGEGIATVDDFKLHVKTDFAGIDFPPQDMSPSSEVREGNGWNLDWDFARVVTGHGVGVLMPEKLQPGDLASELLFFAPISLFFFFLLCFVLTTLRGIEFHPMNYVFVAGGFFAFDLLFAYLVDHLAIVPAFAVASAVSVLLVVSYLRLVVGNRLAYLELAGGQLLYLVGFAMAFFWEGYTGLTITVLAIATLFLLMQLTGRVKWADVFARPVPKAVAARA